MSITFKVTLQGELQTPQLQRHWNPHQIQTAQLIIQELLQTASIQINAVDVHQIDAKS